MASFSAITQNSSSVFVVAEVSGNHAGKIDNCIALIHAAKYAGADAVKFQTYTPATLTLDANMPDFVIPATSPWADYRTQYALYSSAYTPWEWHPRLFEEARKLDLIAFSSPFDESAVDFLETLDCPIYKLASPEINHIPLIQKIATTGKPIIMSLGVATENELDRAIHEFSRISKAWVGILQCDTAYPARIENSNLSQVTYLRQKYDHVIGFSDHTLGADAACAAVALGARIVEKHIRIETDEDSPDTFFSTEKKEFKEMVSRIRATENLMGIQKFRQSESSKDYAIRRSIYPTCDIAQGEVIGAEMLKVVRPGFGIPPEFIGQLVGCVARRFISRGERISLSDFEFPEKRELK
jgi:pseudaminic acid synthase